MARGNDCRSNPHGVDRWFSESARSCVTEYSPLYKLFPYGYDKTITNKVEVKIMFRKNKLAMLVGEFLGTGLLTLVVLAALRSQAGTYFVAVAAGLLLVVLVLALGGISGAVFNPAITIALWSARKLRTAQALMYIVVQFAGAYAAWYLFVYLTKIDTSSITHSNVTELTARPLLGEAIGAFIFAFAIAAALYQKFQGGLKAFTIGSGLTLGAWVASLASAAFINPAVALAIQQWNIYTYMLAPVLGAVLGINVYNLLFVETEVAEVAEAKAEAKELKAAEAHVVAAPAPVKKAPAKKAAAKKPAAKKKTASKK